MKVAALYDIHGNLPALEAVLSEVRVANVDLIVAGGDVFLGPMPRETLACLLDCGISVEFIVGNCEVAALEQMAGREPVKVPEQYRPPIRWSARELSVHDQAMILEWP